MADLPGTTLRFRRTGGIFAGNVLETTVPADELPGELREVAAALDDIAASRAPDRAPFPDGYQYELVVERGRPAQRLIVGAGALPAELRPLVTYLERRATDERGGPSR
jgi:hypothetical protein